MKREESWVVLRNLICPEACCKLQFSPGSRGSSFKSFPVLMLHNWTTCRWMIQPSRLSVAAFWWFSQKSCEAINAPTPNASTRRTPGWRCQATSVVIQRQFNMWQRRMLKLNAMLQRALSRRTQATVMAAENHLSITEQLLHAPSNNVKTFQIYRKIYNLFPYVFSFFFNYRTVDWQW